MAKPKPKPKPQRRAAGAAPSAAPAARSRSVTAPTAQHDSSATPAAANRSGPSPTALHRSGAVARMLRMPVATLRVWERRYRLTQPALSPSGQRLYSAGDVQRLALLKQLTDLGHAIGSLAPLDMRQLQQVAATHAQALAVRSQGGGVSEARLRRRASGVSGVSGVSRASSASGASGASLPVLPPVLSTAAPAAPSSSRTASRGSTAPPEPPTQPTPPWRLAVIGLALIRRLQRPAVQQHLRRLGRPVALVGPFDDARQAALALQTSPAGALQPRPADALIVQLPRLHDGWLADVRTSAPSLAGLPLAVLYGFAADPVCEAMAAASTALLREPQPDAVLAPWLHGWLLACTAAPPLAQHRPARGAEPIPPRRWDDAALADFAGLSSTVACECPRHVAELLVQLSQFEAYSAECEHRSPADAELHTFLRRVAAASRAQFESALEHVALHEGLTLPAAPAEPRTPPKPPKPPKPRTARS